MAAKLMARVCGVSSCLTAVTTTAAVIATATAMTVFALEPRRSCFRTEAMTGSPPPTRVLIWNRSMLSAAVMTPCLLGSLVIGASTWTEAVQTRLIHDATAYELPARTGRAGTRGEGGDRAVGAASAVTAPAPPRVGASNREAPRAGRKAQMNSDRWIADLVLEGGGVKGIGLVGAV